LLSSTQEVFFTPSCVEDRSILLLLFQRLTLIILLVRLFWQKFSQRFYLKCLISPEEYFHRVNNLGCQSLSFRTFNACFCFLLTFTASGEKSAVSVPVASLKIMWFLTLATLRAC
jgi:hypothetical protein